MKDINIEPILLSETIEILKNDNEKIHKTITNINKLIKDLDSTKWKSPEKEKIDIELLPYLEYQENNIYNSLNDCVLIINRAKEIYQATDEETIRIAETLDNYSSLGDV